MNKGEAIRFLITEGEDDGSILSQVPTTLNSIRWHRSKMQRPSAPRTVTSVAALTVGAAAEKFGFKDTILEGLHELCTHNAENLYDELASWSFKTNGRAQSRYGQCDHGACIIEVHEKLLDLADDLKMTFLHEVAHALDYMIHGESSHHGPNWKRIMVALGCEPRRCGGHSKTAADALAGARAIARQTRRVLETWTCRECAHEQPIFKKHKYPASQYRHARCGGIFYVK